MAWRIPVRICRDADSTHAESLRAYAHTFCRPSPTICVASAFFDLDPGHRDGILAHEIGHLLAGPKGNEEAADRAFEEATGVRIRYRDGDNGRCLQWLPPDDRRRLLGVFEFDFSGKRREVDAPDGDDVRFFVQSDGVRAELGSLEHAESVADVDREADVWAQEGRRRLGWRPLTRNPRHPRGALVPPEMQRIHGVDIRGRRRKNADDRLSRTAVVDGDGRPLVVYHATNRKFERFYPYSHFGSRASARDRARDLAEFSEDVVGRDAGRFRVHAVYLNIENPLRMQDLADVDAATGLPMNEAWERFFERNDLDQEAWDELTADEQDSYDEAPRPRGWEGEESVGTTLLEMGVIDMDEFDEKGRSNEGAFELLAEKGHDGIVYDNVVEDPGSESWINFREDQVMPASDPQELPSPRVMSNPQADADATALVQAAHETGAGGMVIRPGGKVSFVKNLGWLLKHAGKHLIRLVEIVTPVPGSNSAGLVVRFDDGTSYVALWASSSVLWDWLDRPVLHGAPAVWHDTAMGISSEGTIEKGMSGKPRGVLPNPDDDGRYFFVHACPGSTYEDIRDLRDSERRISRRTFAKKLAPGQWEWIRRELGYDRRLPISKADWQIPYFKGVYRGVPAVFLEHSRIEYIFTLDGCMGPTKAPRGG